MSRRRRVSITTFQVVDGPAAAGAAEMARAISDALSARGRCAVALSRGAEFFRHLATAPASWEAVDVFQVDERAAPDGSSDRNLTTIERELCANIAGPRPRVHPMPVTGDLESGASAYAVDLEGICGAPVVLDVVHLGLGADGHIASLVPGDPVLDVVDRPVAVTGLYRGYRRMTLTYPVLDAARCIVFVVSGASKAHAVAAVRSGDTSAPAARIRASDVRFFCDAPAAESAENRR